MSNGCDVMEVIEFEEFFIIIFDVYFFFFKPKAAYEMLSSRVGSEMCIRDRARPAPGAAMQIALPQCKIAPIRRTIRA